MVFTQAGRIIERSGWHQGSFTPSGPLYEPDRPVCAMGAINLAAGAKDPEIYIDLGALAIFARYIAPRGDIEPAEQIAIWNDDPGRTVADVLGALRGIARTARTLVTPTLSG